MVDKIDSNSNKTFKHYDQSILESMPIEICQREAIITEKEVKEHKTLIIKVSVKKSNI